MLEIREIFFNFFSVIDRNFLRSNAGCVGDFLFAGSEVQELEAAEMIVTIPELVAARHKDIGAVKEPAEIAGRVDIGDLHFRAAELPDAAGLGGEAVATVFPEAADSVGIEKIAPDVSE